MRNAVLPDFLVTPRQLLQDREIQPLDCHVYGIIYWYTNMRLQICIATNKSIAQTLQASEGSIKNAITRLVRKGYIKSIYDRKQHQRELIPLLVFGKTSTASYHDLPDEEHVMKQCGSTSSLDASTQPHIASLIKEDYIKETEDILHISSGAVAPKDLVKNQQHIYGNDEINTIVTAFSTHIGHIPSDKRPRQVAQHIRRIIHTFINLHTDLFQKLRGRALDFAYMHQLCWEWYGKKEYALQTEKLETFKLKIRMYLDHLSQQLEKEAVFKDPDKHDTPAERLSLVVELTKQDREALYQEMKESPIYGLFLAQKEAARQRNWARVKDLAEQARHIPLSPA